MKMFKYKNIKITKQYNKANFVTHSGTFHVDDVISTVFLSKIFKEIKLIRVPSIENRNTNNKLVFDIGLGEFDHHQKNKNVKYLIFKSKRKCYDIRIIDKDMNFKKEIVISDIKQARSLSNISDLLYVDIRGKLCCTETLDSAINLVKYNDNIF